MSHPAEAVDPAGAALTALRSGAYFSGPAENSTDTTSGLTIDEQIAIAQVGYEPQDVVNGAAVVRLGINGKNTLHPFSNYEVVQLSRTMGFARQHAVSQMEKQCAEIEAAGVIGVHLDLAGTEEGDLVTFVASGTAVRPIGPKAEGGASVFTSSLSGQDFHLLLRSGCVPIGFVVGTSVFHFGWRSFGKWASSQGRCTELSSLTSSLYAARELAIERLRRQALHLGADGVIDVSVLERADVWSSHVIEFVAYGTAITLGEKTALSAVPDILVLLNDRATTPTSTRSSTFARE
ncbi:MAG TPA: heavy metal-binding domain-containing protein [Acidimicrobiales bacterium]|jgi:uncharacterized protein YbjQ (UPF0145 family)|nr:heavy metal-binding domain-containing protein [Acidimicrobiales bacterium]